MASLKKLTIWRCKDVPFFSLGHALAYKVILFSGKVKMELSPADTRNSSESPETKDKIWNEKKSWNFVGKYLKKHHWPERTAYTFSGLHYYVQFVSKQFKIRFRVVFL